MTYVGKESTEPVDARDAAVRRPPDAAAADSSSITASADDPAQAVAFAYPYLGHEDRFIRYAARVALEHQDVKLWQDRVLAERDPETLITGAVGLARQGDKSLQPRLLEALDRLDFAALPETQQLELLRAWSLVFIRMGEPDPATAARLAKKLDAFFPAQTDALEPRAGQPAGLPQVAHGRRQDDRADEAGPTGRSPRTCPSCSPATPATAARSRR